MTNGTTLEPFSNEPISVERLPQLADEAFVSVDPRYVWARLAATAMAAVTVVGVVALIVWRSGAVAVPAVIGGALVLVLSAIALVWILESRRLAYQVREHDLSLRSGVIHHRVETVPFSRVQHVSVGRGLIERWLGLATLEVSSAGPDLSVPGLAHEDADRIKQVVAERAGVDEEDDGDGEDGIDDRDDDDRARPAPTPWPPPPTA